MKIKLLSILALLCLTASSAWALDVRDGDSWDETTKTLTVNSDVEGSYYYCNEIEHLIIGSGVTSIGEVTFKDCSGLTSITFEGESKLETIGEEAFCECSGLTSLTIPASVKTIGVSAFESCSGLTSLTIPASVKTIGEAAFFGCSGLTSLTIGNDVTSIGQDAFLGCTSVTDVYCYADPSDLRWYDANCNDFCYDGEHPYEKTKCHVTDADAWSGFTNVNVSFEGDLLGTAPLTANAAEGYNWATYYNSSEQNIKVGKGTQVFKVKLTDDTTLELTEITDGVINAGKAVVLKSATNVNFLTAASASETSYEYNSLVGTTTSITNPGNAYVLGYKEGTGVGFYKLKSGGTIGAGKAYLVYTGTGAPEFFGFGDATGVNTLNVERGTLNGEVYNLNGQRVEHPTKGLYIVGGKKVVIK